MDLRSPDGGCVITGLCLEEVERDIDEPPTEHFARATSAAPA
jgi:hypothetical protein